MTPEQLRQSTLETARWLRSRVDKLDCPSSELVLLSELLEKEVDRDLRQVEPRPALLSILERPRRQRLLDESKAPRFEMQEEHERQSLLPRRVLESLKPMPLGDGSSSLLFQNHPGAVYESRGVSFGYRSFWDEEARALQRGESSCDVGWSSLDFSALFLESLVSSAKSERWERQLGLLSAHRCQDYKLVMGPSINRDSLARAFAEQPSSSRWERTGLIEAPFFLGRLAKLLGPPPENWGGGSYHLVGEVGGSFFSAVGSNGTGHGVFELVGTVEGKSSIEVASTLHAIASTILEGDELADVKTHCVHFDEIYSVGAVDGCLLYQPVDEPPFWIDAFWQFSS